MSRFSIVLPCIGIYVTSIAMVLVAEAAKHT
jgi:hypothetical protein